MEEVEGEGEQRGGGEVGGEGGEGVECGAAVEVDLQVALVRADEAAAVLVRGGGRQQTGGAQAGQQQLLAGEVQLVAGDVLVEEVAEVKGGGCGGGLVGWGWGRRRSGLGRRGRRGRFRRHLSPSAAQGCTGVEPTSGCDDRKRQLSCAHGEGQGGGEMTRGRASTDTASERGGRTGPTSADVRAQTLVWPLLDVRLAVTPLTVDRRLGCGYHLRGDREEEGPRWTQRMAVFISVPWMTSSSTRASCQRTHPMSE